MDRLSELRIRPLLLTWVCNYLSNRNQHVVVNGKSSSTLDMLSGIPQGSVLGPPLLLIYIDMVTSVQLSPGKKMLVYADDILVYKPVSDISCYQELQGDIDGISNWSEVNLMHFNVAKCKCMLITCKRNVSCPTLKLKGADLEQVTKYKYLGVTISSNLSWSPHIEQIGASARKVVGLIYRNFANNINYLMTILCLYISLVRPRLEYALQVWDPHLLKDICKLGNVQKLALRICSGQYHESYEKLRDIFHIPSLSNRRCYLSMCTLFNIAKGHIYLTPSSIFLSPHTQTCATTTLIPLGYPLLILTVCLHPFSTKHYTPGKTYH